MEARTADLATDLESEGFTTVELPEDEPLENILITLSLGDPTRARRSVLAPKSEGKARRFSLSERFGRGAFEAHTDGAHRLIPPRWIVMRLEPGARSDTPTLLWDFASLGVCDSCVDKMRRGMWVAHGGGAPFYTSILRTHDGQDVLRFNRTCMRPIGRDSGKAGEDLVNALFVTPAVEHSWIAGQALIIDNWRVLHARPAVTDNDEQDRRLERMLVEATN